MNPVTEVQQLPAGDQLLLFLLRERAERGVSDLLLAAVRASRGIAALEDAVDAIESLHDALTTGRRRDCGLRATASKTLCVEERALLGLLHAERNRHHELAEHLALWLVNAGRVADLRASAARLVAGASRDIHSFWCRPATRLAVHHNA